MPIRVLIVDDDAGLCEILVRLLEAFGYKADSITDPRRVLATLEEHSYDLALVDLIMPHIGGFDLVKVVQAERPMPMIVITGYGSVDLAKAALEAGAVDFVTKPIEGTYLDMRIKKVLGLATTESP